MWGRPSPASRSPWRLRSRAAAASASIRADGGDAAGLAIRAASLSGARHRLSGAGPDDAYAWAVTAAGVAVAVADGVGSREGSDAAAAAAVLAAVDALADPTGSDAPAGPEDDLRAAVRAAAQAVRVAGGATTLVVAVVAPDGHAVVARVGDSGAWVLTGGAWREVWPAGGDAGSITTATDALPSEPTALDVAGVLLGAGDALVLVTDGVADPLRDGPTTVAPGLAAALASPPGPLELARVLDFSRQGCHDDRTLLAVWWEPGA